MRPVAENGLILNGYQLIPEIMAKREDSPGFGGTITWSRNGEPLADIGYTFWGLTFTLNYNRRGEPVPPYQVQLRPMPQPKGGLRYLFVCPLQGCGRQTFKLYLPNGADHFGCRHCYNLTYRSCNQSHHYERLLRSMATLARRFGSIEGNGTRAGVREP
jgi:hypothetical protein